MATDEFAEYISLVDAAKQYKVAKTFWYDAVKAGKIRAFELPGRRGTFFLRADLEAFWKPREIKPEHRDETA